MNKLFENVPVGETRYFTIHSVYKKELCDILFSTSLINMVAEVFINDERICRLYSGKNHNVHYPFDINLKSDDEISFFVTNNDILSADIHLHYRLK